MADNLRAIRYKHGRLSILDQLKLPHETKYVEIASAEQGFKAIQNMVVRGAPAIAIVAALSLAVEVNKNPRMGKAEMLKKLDYLVKARPTAVNLFDAAQKLKRVIENATNPGNAYLDAAEKMLVDDVEDNRSIGNHGADWLIKGSKGTKIAVLTHCNTGSLATAGYGTALGIVRCLHERSSLSHVYCTESRPYNQGSRLTAYELVYEKIPCTLVTDSMAAALMQLRKEVKAVIVGADRVVANGDTANKIGTYGLAILARRHGLKFIVAAPTTSIDMSTKNGEAIVVEQRPAQEVERVTGPVIEGGKLNIKNVKTVCVPAQGINIWNPAFDVTPAELIDAIVTEKGVVTKLNGRFHLNDIIGKTGLPAKLTVDGQSAFTNSNIQKPLKSNSKIVNGRTCNVSEDSSPLVNFLSPLSDPSTRYATVPLILLTIWIYKLAVALGPYSGSEKGPMYGDFEAQRHWMEMTLHLPIEQWYYHDLQWWGLDYPPLTALHSWLIGKIGQLFNPSWFELYVSRGVHDPNLKTFMRLSVLVSEFAIFVPAVFRFCRWWGRYYGLNRIEKAVAITSILFQPALILIDHGHFQYNSVMLGLSILSISYIFRNRYVAASIAFALSYTYKQMALYYAPAFFAYLLGRCVYPSVKVQRFFILGITVASAMLVIFAPFIWAGGSSQIRQILHRCFPFARGLYEDKVANVWCAVNVLYKLRSAHSIGALQKFSLLATLVAIALPCMLLFLYPQKRLLPWGLAATAWGFFLFSFQVHEKSVLLPLMPMTLLLSNRDKDIRPWIGWINNVAVFSLWPLLKRDGLGLQYLVITFFWNWLCGLWRPPRNVFSRILHWSVYLFIFALHVAEVLWSSVVYPDIWVVANVELCCGAFIMVYIWTIWQLWLRATSEDMN